MYQRTLVMQRNVRMVLILVDGQSTVADLTLKTGNSQLTENALRELEKAGFIEPRLEHDAMRAESRKVAHETRALAINAAIEISSPGAKGHSKPPVSESPMGTHSVLQTPVQDNSPSSEVSHLQIPAMEISAGSLPPAFSQQRTEQVLEGRAEGAANSTQTLLARVKAFLSSPSRKRKDADLIQPIQRGRETRMGWPAIMVYSTLGVLACAFLTVVFFPYDRYLPQVDAALSQATGRPAKVGTMQVSIYPKPGLFLGQVRIGADKDEIRIAEIRLKPVINTLMASKLIFREVVLSGVSLPAEVLAGLPGAFVAMAKPVATVGVENVLFEKADVSFGGLGFSGMDGEAKLSADGLLQVLLLRSEDRSLSLEAKPVAQGLDVTVDGFGWRPFQGSPFLFDSVNLRGAFENGVFTISNMELRIFDGLIQGGAVLRADKRPSVTGEVRFERINATRLGEALGLGQQFSGESTGKIRFLSSADSWASIFSGIEADGEFSMRRGSIRGIDLAEAVRRVSNAPVQGGSTLFENLAGRIKLTPTSYQFSELTLNSGLMQSSGNIEVSKDLKVRGKLELHLLGTANQTRVPISITGPLRAPEVMVGKG